MIRGLILFVAFFSCFAMQAKFLVSNHYRILCLLKEHNGKLINEQKTATLEIEAMGTFLCSIKCKEIGLDYSFISNHEISPYLDEYNIDKMLELENGSKETFMKLVLVTDDYVFSYLRALRGALIQPSLAIYIRDGSNAKMNARLVPVNVKIYDEGKKEWNQIQYVMLSDYKEDWIYKFLYEKGRQKNEENVDYNDSRIVVD